jgi:transposase
LRAAHYNPVIKPFYDRLRAAGKPQKVARCAAARKLLHLAWALVTKEQDFDPTYAQRPHARAR